MIDRGDACFWTLILVCIAALKVCLEKWPRRER